LAGLKHAAGDFNPDKMPEIKSAQIDQNFGILSIFK
jgi:hypothetical protein